MQRCGVDIAIQRLARARQLGKAVRAVYNHEHAARTRHAHDLTHRQHLAGEIDDVTHQNDPRARCDGGGEAVDNFIGAFHGHRQRDRAQDDTLALAALA